MVLLAFARYLFAAVPEEVGWRGFAVPALQERHTALVAALVVGLVAFVWHLPLVLGGDPYMSQYPLVPYFICFLGLSVIYVWLYNNSRGSLLILVLAHAVSNVIGLFSSAPVATAALTAGVAVLLVIVFGPEHLSRTGSRPTLSRTAPEVQGSR